MLENILIFVAGALAMLFLLTFQDEYRKLREWKEDVDDFMHKNRNRND